MSIYSSNVLIKFQRFFSAFVIIALLMSVVPASAFAEETPTSGESGEGQTSIQGGEDTTGDEGALDGADGADGSGTGEGDTDGSENGDNPDVGGESGSFSPSDTGEESTDGGGSDGVDGSDGTEYEEGQEESEEGTDSDTTEDDSASEESDDGNTSESDSTTDDGEEGGDASQEGDGVDGDDAESGTDTNGTEGAGPDGTEGADGTEGEDGGANTEEETPENPDPILIISENEVADDVTPDDGEEVTGSRTVNGHRSKVTIETGEATAQAELTSDVNSGDIKSLIDLDTFDGDLDNYYFNATGTNDADIANTASVIALTGDNVATTHGGPAEIKAGNAYAALNIANVANSTVVNSDGFLYLGNRILEPNQSLDLTDFFFPDPEGELARANDCDLLSCVAEDIHYNFSQTNTAVVTNNASLEAVSGENYIDTETSLSKISTGDAYGGANIINVVNTNIVDSNYRFLTLNAMGDLDGDILLPTQELFTAFYSRPNGMTQLEDAEDLHVTVSNTNDADVQNGLDTKAETGLNEVTASVDPVIVTGDASSESNVLNKINQNIFGGDVMHLLIRVHGAWDGEVRGLPEGLTWRWTADGILIYNEGAEIAPSPFLPYDVDSYNAEITDFNYAEINNNVTIDATTGKNEAKGSIGTITTGNAFASANVMNIANTNVIGANWTFAVINIFGDFEGDIAFSEINLSLTGEVSGPELPGPGDVLTYTYTVHNNSTVPAMNVVLEQTLENATVDGSSVTQSVNFGDLGPGASASAQLTATIDNSLPVGESPITAVAVVNSDEAEATPEDNAVLLSLLATFDDQEAGTTTDEDNASSTDPDGTDDPDDTGSDPEIGDDNNNNNNNNNNNPPSSGGCGGCDGGGGGDDNTPTNKTKSIDRSEAADVSNQPTSLVIRKESSVDNNEIVKAGQTVDYTITVINGGDTVYDAVVYDTLVNPIDAVLNEQSWDLGTVLAGEEVVIEYSTDYSLLTPTGAYTNTASIKAYEKKTGKADGDKPRILHKAVHTIEIEGVDLGIGNIGVVAYYPGSQGRINALVTWETSKPASGQVLFSPTSLGSKYNPLLPNYGYQRASFRFNTPKTKHYMILRNLAPGVGYNYKIRSTKGDTLAVRGDYTFTVPNSLTSLAIALPDGRIAELSRVAGATISKPVPTTPLPASASHVGTPYTPPTKPSAKTQAAKTETPEPTPDQPAEKPADQAKGDSEGGFFSGVTKKVFGLFR